MTTRLLLALASLTMIGSLAAQQPVGDKLTSARAADGSYISWREHLVDDPVVAGVPFNGSDGLVAPPGVRRRRGAPPPHREFSRPALRPLRRWPNLEPQHPRARHAHAPYKGRARDR